MAPVYVLFPFAVVKRPARIKYDRAFANLKTDTTWWTHGSPTRGGLTCEMAKMWLPRVHCAFFSPLRLRPPLFCHFRPGLSYTVGLTKKYCSNKSEGLSRTNVSYLWLDFLSCLLSLSPPRGSKGTAVVSASGNDRRWSDANSKDPWNSRYRCWKQQPLQLLLPSSIRWKSFLRYTSFSFASFLFFWFFICRFSRHTLTHGIYLIRHSSRFIVFADQSRFCDLILTRFPPWCTVFNRLWLINE